MEYMQRVTWMVPVIAIAAVDLLVRSDQVARWSAVELQIYAISCAVALGWVRLTSRAVYNLRQRSSAAFWATLALLSIWSAVLALPHFAFYFRYGAQVGADTFRDAMAALRDSPGTLGDALTPLHQLLLLSLAALFLPLWRLSVAATSRRPNRQQRLLPLLLFVVILTLLFLWNVDWLRGNFLPSINTLLTFAHAVAG